MHAGNGLQTSLLVRDGGPSNLTTIKATHGHTGMYRTSTLMLYNHGLLTPMYLLVNLSKPSGECV